MMVEPWLERVAAIRQWRQGGVRAPHKPLLLLYLLGRVQRGEPREVSFDTAEAPLSQLLNEFGPPHPTSPAYPFYHLQSDGLWQLSGPHGAPTGPVLTQLRFGVQGRLAPDFDAALRTDPDLLVAIARQLLDTNFPSTLHPDVCAAVGLDLDSPAVPETPAAPGAAASVARDPTFRPRILMAYEYRCAVCGYDGRLASTPVGLEAAHVMWRAAKGPNSVDNGLCLCTLHHKLLDIGILGIDENNRLLVSAGFVGGERATDLAINLANAPLRPPQAGQPEVAPDYAAWHRGQVFKPPARLTV